MECWNTGILEYGARKLRLVLFESLSHHSTVLFFQNIRLRVKIHAAAPHEHLSKTLSGLRSSSLVAWRDAF